MFYQNRMKTRITGLLAVLAMCSALFGQQGVPTMLSSFNPYYEHASFAGFDRSLSINTQVRKQWLGLDGSPSMQYIGAHMPVYALGGAAGMDISTISEGVLRISQVRGSASKVVGVGGGLLSSAVRIAINQVRIDGNAVRTPQGSYQDGLINHNDGSLGNNIDQGIGLVWELSALFSTPDFNIAVSIADLANRAQQVGNGKYVQDRSIYVYSQYLYPINENITAMPSLAVRTNGKVVQTDVVGQISYKANNYIGIGLRGYSGTTIDAFSLILGHKLNSKFGIYYSYESGLSQLKYTNEGTHDLLLKVNMDVLFGKNVPPKITYNPRFL